MIDNFIPLLIQNGVKEDDINQIITQNFSDILEA